MNSNLKKNIEFLTQSTIPKLHSNYMKWKNIKENREDKI